MVRASRTLEMKMGVLLECFSAGKKVLITWAFPVVPSGLSARGPDILLDKRPLAISDESGLRQV